MGEATIMDLLASSRRVNPNEIIHISRSSETPGEQMCGEVNQRSLACMRVSDATCQPCLDVFNNKIVEEYGLGK